MYLTYRYNIYIYTRAVYLYSHNICHSKRDALSLISRFISARWLSRGSPLSRACFGLCPTVPRKTFLPKTTRNQRARNAVLGKEKQPQSRIGNNNHHHNGKGKRSSSRSSCSRSSRKRQDQQQEQQQQQQEQRLQEHQQQEQ